MTKIHAVLLCQLAAFWPVWSWYAARLTDGSDEPWGAAALVAAGVLSWNRGRASELGTAQTRIVAVTLALYAVSYLFVPPLLRAVLAVVSLSATASALRSRRGMDTALLGTALLSLPLIASLQFYLGYPLRVVSAQISARLIGAMGYIVAVQGSTFEWRGDPVLVDAPCSGVKMLWCGMFATFALAAALRLDARRTWRAQCAASLLIFSANVLRVTVLFFSETHLIAAPGYFHEAVGLALFAAVLALTSAHVRRLSYATTGAI